MPERSDMWRVCVWVYSIVCMLHMGLAEDAGRLTDDGRRMDGDG